MDHSDKLQFFFCCPEQDNASVKTFKFASVMDEELMKTLFWYLMDLKDILVKCVCGGKRIATLYFSMGFYSCNLFPKG